MSGGRNLGAYKNARKIMLTQAAALNLPCSICGGRILYDQNGNHPYGPTADHTTPVSLGGQDNEPNPDLLRPAHRRCQSKQGATISNRSPKRRRPAQGPMFF